VTSNQPLRVTQVPVLPAVTLNPIPLPVAVRPEVPVREVWEWLTVVQQAGNSKEQRVALRERPRYIMAFDIFLESEEKRRDVYQLFQYFYDKVVQYPMYQHASVISQDTLATGTKLYFDPTLTDIRASEDLALFNPMTEVTTYETISTVDADGATLVSPLAADVYAGWYVMPSINWRIDGSAKIDMSSITGSAVLALTSVGTRTFQRPDTTATLTTLDGLTVLDQRPIIAGTVDEEWEQDVTWFDNDTSIQTPFTAWPGPFIKGRRTFKLNRFTEMDYWRAFADACVGRREPFLLPTFRDDLPLTAVPSLSSKFITTSNVQYGRYFFNLRYRYVQIHTDNGIIYRRVDNMVINYDVNGDAETVTIELATALGGSAGDNIISKVSFLNKARLDNDNITIEHEGYDATLTLDVRTVDR